MRSEPKPPMKTDSGWWANKEEVVVVPANTTEELMQKIRDVGRLPDRHNDPWR